MVCILSTRRTFETRGVLLRYQGLNAAALGSGHRTCGKAQSNKGRTVSKSDDYRALTAGRGGVRRSRGLQTTLCGLKASRISLHSSFQAWQGKSCIQTEKADKDLPSHCSFFEKKKKKKVAVTSNQHFPDASSGNVTGCPTREQIQKSGSPAPQGPERHCTIPPRRQPPIRVHCHTERAHCHPAPPGTAARLLDRPRGLCINPRKGPLQKWNPGRRWHPAFLCGLRYHSDWLLYRAWKCSSVYYKSQIVIFIFLGLM